MHTPAQLKVHPSDEGEGVRRHSSFGDADKVTGKWSCPRQGADRIINRLEYRRDPLGDASADLVERAHRSEQHTTVRRGGKSGITNFTIELSRSDELAVRPLCTARLKHSLYRIVKKKAVESVSVHQVRNILAPGRSTRRISRNACRSVGAIEIAQDLDADHKIEALVWKGKLSRHAGDNRSGPDFYSLRLHAWRPPAPAHWQ